MRLSKIERGLCYQPKPEADNTNRGTDNSHYQAKTKFNNYCFILHKLVKQEYIQETKIVGQLVNNLKGKLKT